MPQKTKINFPNKIIVENTDLLEKPNGRKYCGLAYKDNGLIKIDPTQSPKEYLDTLIHESLHILFTDWSEEEVYDLAVFFSNFLWENGYRKIHSQLDSAAALGMSPKGHSSTQKNIRKMKIPPPIKSNDYSKIKEEYQKMFSDVTIKDKDSVSKVVDKIIKNKENYQKIDIAPWYWIGCIHHREASLNFKTHLHNGDPLTARTVNVPAGRPKGQPTTIGGYAWDVSARDALFIKSIDKWFDWSISGMLFQAERYNGWGYRLYKNNNSPYLWSGTQFWVSGKYVSDGKYDINASRDQIGVAAILSEMKSRQIF